MSSLAATFNTWLQKNLYDTQIWKSMFRNWPWQDTPRHRARHIVDNVWLHIHSTKVRPRAIAPSFTWGMGVISFWLFCVLTVTGVLLMFYYRPTTELAYRDMKDLEFAVTLGMFLRNAHRWSAHAMVVAVIVHMVRVYLTGSYKKPREFNWGVGVVLLSLTLFMSFTGYLLPWDQLAIWAVTVGTNMAAATPIIGNEGPLSPLFGVTSMNDIRFAMLGGTNVGENTLIRFYVLHCVLVPLVMVALITIHFWRIRKDTFSAAPYKPDEEKVDVWPHVVYREYLLMLATLVGIFLWSVLQNAPLEELANPTVTPNPSKAPWYFVGLQELLVYFDPWIAGVMIPNLIIVGLIAIPYVDTNPKGVGYFSFKERPLSQTMFLFGMFFWFLLIFIGYYCRGPSWNWYWPWESWEVHKPLPPPTWDFHPILGALGIGAYFGLGLVLPKIVKGALSWKKAWTGFLAAIALFGAVMMFKGAGFGTVVLLAVCLASVFFLAFLMPQRYLQELEWPRYSVSMLLILMMTGVVIKIFLRLGFDVKYIFSWPQINLNI